MPTHERPSGIEWLQEAAQRWAEPAIQWRANARRWVDGDRAPSRGDDEVAAAWRAATTVAPSECEVLSSMQEASAYFLVVVIGVVVTLVVGRYWIVIGPAGHVVVGVVSGVAGLASGRIVARLDGVRARRVSGVLWLLGTFGVAMAIAIVVSQLDNQHRGLTLFVVGMFVLSLSALLWRNEDRPLQFLSALMGEVLTLGGVGTLGRIHATSSEISLFIWLFAFAIGLMGLQMLRPASTALIVAVVGSLVAAFALTFPHHFEGVALGLLTAVVSIAVGMALVRPLIVVLGALGFFMFDIRAFSLFVQSANAARGVFILGLVIAIVALLSASHVLPLGVKGRRDIVAAQHEVVAARGDALSE
jgi:hypothetical protein